MRAWLWHTMVMMWTCCTAAAYGAVAEGRALADEPMARPQALADALREAVCADAGGILYFFKLTYQ